MNTVFLKKSQLYNLFQLLNTKYRRIVSLMFMWIFSCLLLTLYCYLHAILSSEPVFGFMNSLLWSIKQTCVLVLAIGVLLFNYELLIQSLSKRSIALFLIVITFFIEYWLFGTEKTQGVLIYLYQQTPKFLFFSWVTWSLLYPKESIQNCEFENSSEIKRNDKLLVSNGIGEQFINISEIDHIKSYGNYIEIYDSSRKVYLHRMTMKVAEKYFSEHGFIRVHRSHLVALSKVQQVKKINSKLMEIILHSDQVIPVGVNYRDQFNAFRLNK